MRSVYIPIHAGKFKLSVVAFLYAVLGKEYIRYKMKEKIKNLPAQVLWHLHLSQAMEIKERLHDIGVISKVLMMNIPQIQYAPRSCILNQQKPSSPSAPPLASEFVSARSTSDSKARQPSISGMITKQNKDSWKHRAKDLKGQKYMHENSSHGETKNSANNLLVDDSSFFTSTLPSSLPLNDEDVFSPTHMHMGKFSVHLTGVCDNGTETRAAVRNVLTRTKLGDLQIEKRAGK